MSLLDENVLEIRNQINMKKNLDIPHYGTKDTVITDMDHFPYTRFYRGSYTSENPIIMEREAGWRPHEKSCYTTLECTKTLPNPSHCFETACSTVFPCYSNTLPYYADKEALMVQINNHCINQYR